MALVGSIRVGTINGLVQSLQRTNVKATLTVRSGEDEGTITFNEGELADCEVDVLDGADALDEMLAWTHGQFTLRIIDAAAPDISNTPGTPGATGATGAPGPPGPHVIVVDDELGIRKLIEAFLEAEGYQVSVVSQASQAVNLVDYCKPDLVLLDVMLTGLDGFELAALLRQQYSEKQLPIVLMSANHDFQERADQEGFHFFGKPFDFKKLCKIIETLTSSAAASATASAAASVSAPAPVPASAPASAPAPTSAPTSAPVPAPANFLTLPARFASLLDAEAHLPSLDQCYMVDEVAKARFALVGPSPALAAIVAGFDGFLTLRQWLDEDPDTREQRILMALLLHSVGALKTADAAFGV